MTAEIKNYPYHFNLSQFKNSIKYSLKALMKINKSLLLKVFILDTLKEFHYIASCGDFPFVKTDFEKTQKEKNPQ